jgi:hypothetical protein
MLASSSSAARNSFCCRTRSTGDQDDKAGVQLLCLIETAEIAGVVGDEDKITVTRIAGDVPVLPTGLADMCHVLGVMAHLPGDSDQVDAEAFVDQKPHDAAMMSSLRRDRCTGF